MSKSVSATAEEALSLRVIDVMANDVPQLLSALDGRVMHFSTGDRKLTFTGVQLSSLEMDFREKVLGVLTDPTIAYLLLLLGVLAIVVEVSAPHGFVKGTVGVVAVLLALVAWQIFRCRTWIPYSGGGRRPSSCFRWNSRASSSRLGIRRRRHRNSGPYTPRLNFSGRGSSFIADHLLPQTSSRPAVFVT